MPSPEPETKISAQRKIVEAAQKMLAGSLSFIEGVRMIAGLRFAADIENDSDARAFVAIDSETDALPFGKVRALWEQEALDALQCEIESAEKWARETGSVPLSKSNQAV